LFITELFDLQDFSLDRFKPSAQVKQSLGEGPEQLLQEL